MGKILICADSASIAMPELMGIAEPSLEAFGWLECLSDASKARERCREGGISEAWIVGSDDLTSLNLAAALLADHPSLATTIVESNASGSFLSRAAQAHVERVVSADELCALFYAEARRRSLMEEVASLDIESIRDRQRDASKAEESIDASASCQGDSLHQISSQDDAAHGERLAAPRPASPSSESSLSAASRGDAFVVSVFGGSGGVGKSSFCAMAAHAIAARGFRTAVIDFDLQFGDIASICSDATAIQMDSVLDDPLGFAAVAGGAASNPTVIAHPANIEDSEKMTPHVMAILNGCASAFDVVLINTHAHWDEASVSILEASTCQIFLMDQRSSSVRACMRIAELCLRMGLATGSFLYALNGCSKGAMFSPIDVSNAMQGAQVLELADGSTEVEEMLGAGGAAELFESDNPFVRSVKEVVEEILPSRVAKTRNVLAKAKPSASDGKQAKGSALERRSRKAKKKQRKLEDSGADSLFGALFRGADRVDSYLAQEMDAPR